MILQYIILYIIIFGIDNSSLSDIDNFENDFLTLFRMGAGKKPPPLPTSFPPVTSTNVGISSQNVLTFSFSPFGTLV